MARHKSQESHTDCFFFICLFPRISSQKLCGYGQTLSRLRMNNFSPCDTPSIFRLVFRKQKRFLGWSWDVLGLPRRTGRSPFALTIDSAVPFGTAFHRPQPRLSQVRIPCDLISLPTKFDQKCCCSASILNLHLNVSRRKTQLTAT